MSPSSRRSPASGDAERTGAALQDLLRSAIDCLREPVAGRARLFPFGINKIRIKLAAGAASAELEIEGPDSASGAEGGAALLELEAVELPDLQTDAGVMAHMLIAESINPGYPTYDLKTVTTGLNAMKSTVLNRLTDPGSFGAPGATTWKGIITAKGQWHGFSMSGGKVTLASDVDARIKDVLAKANTGTPGKYAEFLKTVLAVTAGTPTDPFASIKKIGSIAVLGGAYGWRTEGSTDPGGRFVKIPATMGGLIAGNQFYTLKV